MLLKSETRIVSSKELNGETVVMLQSLQDGKPIQHETYLVTQAEVRRSRSGSNGNTAIEPPIPVLKLPLEAGKRWTWEGRLSEAGKTRPASAVFHVAAKESLKTPAGEFETFRVGMSMSVGPAEKDRQTQQNGSTIWYAPGVGIVKQLTDQTTELGERSASRILSKYEIKN
jgi:hypothetical protein